MRDNTIELLAPARDADIGMAAISHGADAVYIGGPDFGAREKAGNSVADISRLCSFAHRYNARIYVTLNTILRDDELDLARKMAWDVWNAGADALIVQDMGLLNLDLPPIGLHASTQCDIRTPEKARFLEDVGFSTLVLARELSLEKIKQIASRLDRAKLEFFAHGALCVAYSGLCYISHAHTGRSANRGSCSQECRLPYTVTDAAGGILAHDKHVLSLKDNDQTANLEALIDAGVRSFKIEGRYKDMATVKNVTAHYRQHLDHILSGAPTLRPSSSGATRHFFVPDPSLSFNRGGTDYFVNGRQIDIGAFDTPKHAGVEIGLVAQLSKDHFVVETDSAQTVLNNGDALTWYDLQGELQGVAVNVATAMGEKRWRIEPGNPMTALKDLRKSAVVSRNRDMGWERTLARESAERKIGLSLTFYETEDGFALGLVDEDGVYVEHAIVAEHQLAREAEKAESAIRDALSRLGNTIFTLSDCCISCSRPWFVPASVLNALRREGLEKLDAARAAAFQRETRRAPVEPPVPYPDDTLSYFANVFNHQAAAFYARHGVKVIDSAYESHEHTGEASLMVTKHCVRFSLSLCPKQAKGVTGVQGTVRAESLVLVNGNDRLTLRFDCRACEMHVVGQLRRSVQRADALQTIQVYRKKPISSVLASMGRDE